MGVQNVRKIRSVQDGGILIDSEDFVHKICCVLESKYIRAGSGLLLNIALSVGQTSVDKSLTIRTRN